MIPYKHLKGNSGIKAYEIIHKGILLQFTDGSVYRYTHQSNGKTTIEIMKTLALMGVGLATYINKNIRNKFAEKIT